MNTTVCAFQFETVPSGPMTMHPLAEVAEHVRVEAGRARVAAIFDLDSTLFCVAPRTRAILRALGQDAAFAAEHAELARHLVDVEVVPSDYSVRKILARLPVVPTLETALAVRDYWHERFFSNDHLHHDILYPSAAEYVRRLDALGATVLYLTGRGEARMRLGTERALREHDFPLAPGALLMKPADHLSDEGFKTGVLRDLVRSYDHIWFFENEPVIIHEVRALVPTVRVVFVQSAHSGKGPEPVDVRTILPDYAHGLIAARDDQS